MYGHSYWWGSFLAYVHKTFDQHLSLCNGLLVCLFMLFTGEREHCVTGCLWFVIFTEGETEHCVMAVCGLSYLQKVKQNTVWWLFVVCHIYRRWNRTLCDGCLWFVIFTEGERKHCVMAVCGLSYLQKVKQNTVWWLFVVCHIYRRWNRTLCDGCLWFVIFTEGERKHCVMAVCGLSYLQKVKQNTVWWLFVVCHIYRRWNRTLCDGCLWFVIFTEGETEHCVMVVCGLSYLQKVKQNTVWWLFVVCHIYRRWKKTLCDGCLWFVIFTEGETEHCVMAVCGLSYLQKVKQNTVWWLFVVCHIYRRWKKTLCDGCLWFVIFTEGETEHCVMAVCGLSYLQKVKQNTVWWLFVVCHIYRRWNRTLCDGCLWFVIFTEGEREHCVTGCLWFVIFTEGETEHCVMVVCGLSYLQKVKQNTVWWLFVVCHIYRRWNRTLCDGCLWFVIFTEGETEHCVMAVCGLSYLQKVKENTVWWLFVVCHIYRRWNRTLCDGCLWFVIFTEGETEHCVMVVCGLSYLQKVKENTVWWLFVVCHIYRRWNRTLCDGCLWFVIFTEGETEHCVMAVCGLSYLQKVKQNTVWWLFVVCHIYRRWNRTLCDGCLWFVIFTGETEHCVMAVCGLSYLQKVKQNTVTGCLWFVIFTEGETEHCVMAVCGLSYLQKVKQNTVWWLFVVCHIYRRWNRTLCDGCLWFVIFTEGKTEHCVMVVCGLSYLQKVKQNTVWWLFVVCHIYRRWNRTLCDGCLWFVIFTEGETEHCVMAVCGLSYLQKVKQNTVWWLFVVCHIYRRWKKTLCDGCLWFVIFTEGETEHCVMAVCGLSYLQKVKENTVSLWSFVIFTEGERKHCVTLVVCHIYRRWKKTLCHSGRLSYLQKVKENTVSLWSFVIFTEGEREHCVTLVVCRVSAGGVHQSTVRGLPPPTRALPSGYLTQTRTLDRLLLQVES